MKDLSRDAEDPFLGPLKNAAREDVDQVITDTASRFKANNKDGKYTEGIQELEDAYDFFKTGRSKADKGDQKAATFTVVSSIETIRLTGRELFVKVQSTFGLTSPKVIEFFPTGLTEVNRANRGDFGKIITRWKKKAEANATELGATWVDKLSALEISWEGVKEIQSTEKSNVASGSADIDVTLPALSQALTRLYLLVRLNNLANASETVKIYFDIGPLRRKSNSATDGAGRLIVLGTEKAGNGLANAIIEYRNESTGKLVKGKTDGNGQYRSANQDIGFAEGKITSSDGSLSATFRLEILDDSDPVNTIVLE